MDCLRSSVPLFHVMLPPWSSWSSPTFSFQLFFTCPSFCKLYLILSYNIFLFICSIKGVLLQQRGVSFVPSSCALLKGCPKGIVFESCYWEWKDAERVWNPFLFEIALAVGVLDWMQLEQIIDQISLSLQVIFKLGSLKSKEGYENAQCVLFFIKCCDLVVCSQFYYWKSNFQMLETSDTTDIYINSLCRTGKFSLADIIERCPFRLLVQSSGSEYLLNIIKCC